MRESFRLGRVLGVRVGANWSLLVVFWLIAWALAASELPSVAGGYSTASYWFAGIGVALLFFASLLAHELSHAVVARRARIEVEGIVLWLFGGVSLLKSEPRSPGIELRMAVVGPLTSLGLAAGFFGLSNLAWALGGGRLLASSLAWLALINGVLGVFNLVPAFPLDGGRVLRAFLWWRQHDKYRATATAAGAGRVFGAVLVGLGILALLYGDWLDGLWVGFLGWFLMSAAQAQASMAALARRLAGIRARDVMRPVAAGQPTKPLDQAVTCQADEELVEVARRMAPLRDKPAVVLDHGTVVGVVSPDDVEWAAAHPELVRWMGTRDRPESDRPEGPPAGYGPSGGPGAPRHGAR